MQEYVYSWLENALDLGLTEREFWTMTLAELTRFFASKRRQALTRQKERAAFDYKQAVLIGRCFAATQSRKNKVPSLKEWYAELFQDEQTQEDAEQKQAELYAARFRAFMTAYETNRKKGVQHG